MINTIICGKIFIVRVDNVSNICYTLTREGKMKYQYKRVNTRSLKGLKQAEKLQSLGWKIIVVGLYNILFEKEV